MALNDCKNWLVAYDICDPKRLNRIHRNLKKEALPVQYSVFCFEGNTRQARRLVSHLSGIMNLVADDLRMYSLPEHLQVDIVGRQILPTDGILQFSGGLMAQIMRGKDA